MFITEQEKIIRKFEFLSDKYHKLSLTFHDFAESLRQEGKGKSPKEFREHIKSLNLDINKIKEISTDLNKIELKTLQKDKED